MCFWCFRVPRMRSEKNTGDKTRMERTAATDAVRAVMVRMVIIRKLT